MSPSLKYSTTTLLSTYFIGGKMLSFIKKEERKKPHNFGARDIALFTKLLLGRCEALVSIPSTTGF